MFRISKSESVFAHELEPFVHMRTKDLSGRSKNRTKRRSEPRNVFEDKEKGNYKNSSRKSWHQETEARQVRVFEEKTVQMAATVKSCMSLKTEMY